MSTKKFIIVYDKNNNEFSCSCEKIKDKLNENKITIGEMEYYILKNMLTKIEFLGNSPGIDFIE